MTEITKPTKSELDEEERIFQAERHLEMTRKVIAGERVEEPDR